MNYFQLKKKRYDKYIKGEQDKQKYVREFFERYVRANHKQSLQKFCEDIIVYENGCWHNTSEYIGVVNKDRIYACLDYLNNNLQYIRVSYKEEDDSYREKLHFKQSIFKTISHKRLVVSCIMFIISNCLIFSVNKVFLILSLIFIRNIIKNLKKVLTS